MNREYALIIAALIIAIGLPIMFFVTLQIYLNQPTPSLQELGIPFK